MGTAQRLETNQGNVPLSNAPYGGLGVDPFAVRTTWLAALTLTMVFFSWIEK